MSLSPTSRLVGVSLGTMEFGRYASEESAQRMVSAFVSAGFHELDTASMYCNGETERIIGRFPPPLRSSIRLHSKANPWNTDEQRRGLTRTSVLTQCRTSLASLHLSPNPASPPLDIYYLHAPDHSTPILDTLQAVDELHSEGAFLRFGLSNYSSWQVMEIHHLCQRHGLIAPTAYQGMYNALTRGVEAELLPCLGQLRISFYAYNPLAGGILSGKYRFDQPPQTPGRFAGNECQTRPTPFLIPIYTATAVTATPPSRRSPPFPCPPILSLSLSLCVCVCQGLSVIARASGRGASSRPSTAYRAH